MPLSRAVAGAWIALLCVSAQATEILEARVTHIGDGDSLSVCIERRETRVRLLYIDAPEYRQPFGREARQSLAELCEHRVARLASEGTDRYGRLLARVACNGIDVNAEQVRRGMAWVSRLDHPDASFREAQDRARAQRLGLWSDPEPVPPWQWRKAQRAQAKSSSAPWPGSEARECVP